jgi:hypothetical protein
VLREAFPTEVEFITQFNHRAAIERYSEIKTVQQAYDTEYIKLYELKAVYNKDTPISLIETWLIQLTMYATLPLSTEQISELSLYIYEELYMLNIAELHLFFKFIKKGKYGSFYGRIDPSELTRWCREYRQERGNYISKLPY